MNQAGTKKQLGVRLFKEGENDFLEFNLGGKIHKLNVNLDDNQSAIKAMFCDLLPLLEIDDIELTLDIATDYDNKLLTEVSTSYIADLNKEIASVRTEILDKYSLEVDT